MWVSRAQNEGDAYGSSQDISQGQVDWRQKGGGDARLDQHQLANQSRFGLGACLWTNDEHEREMFLDQIEAGMAFVNGMVASSPPLPFGGIKNSGYGRELGSYGLREFVNLKAISIEEPGEPLVRTE